MFCSAIAVSSALTGATLVALTVAPATATSSAAHVCAGKPATIVGTPDNDDLRGTPKADVIVGLKGKDTITALGGNDIVCGGKGWDTIRGGKGDDKLLGQEQTDHLIGGAGSDILVGGTAWWQWSGSYSFAPNILRGGPGNDVLRGQRRKRWLYHSEADYRTSPTPVTLTARGASGKSIGRDKVFGVTSTALTGKADTVRDVQRGSGFGRILTRGGSDLIVNSSANASTGVGNDAVRYTKDLTTSTWTNLDLGDGDDVFDSQVVTHIGGIALRTRAGDDSIVFGNDSPANDVGISGGDDTYRELAGSGTSGEIDLDMCGGTKDVTGRRKYLIRGCGTGLAGTITLGPANDEVLMPLSSTADIDLGGGNDKITEISTIGSVTGGPGRDLIGGYVQKGVKKVDVDLAAGTASGLGFDSFSSFESYSAELSHPVDLFTVRGTPGPNAFDMFWVDSPVVAYGLGGNDVYDGSARKDTFRGGTGNDKVSGDRGNDDLDGGPGTDTVDGGPGKDVCTNFEAIRECETE